MKTKIIIYCGEDGLAGKAEGLSRRNDETVTALACCYAFDGVPETCDRVVIMPDVPDYRRDKIADAYTCKVEVMRDRILATASVPRDPWLGDRDHLQRCVDRIGPPVELAAEIAGDRPKRQRRPRKMKVVDDSPIGITSVPGLTTVERDAKYPSEELFEPPFVTPDDPAWKGPTE